VKSTNRSVQDQKHE
jgi:hypothetical protein